MADDIDDISIDLNTDIPEKAELSVKHLKNLKNELKATKDAMAGVEEGSEAFTIAAEKAGKLNDKIKDVSEAINAQTGEPIERVAGSFALLGDKLRSLDFKGASVQLANVASGVKSIDFKEILTGMKAFGTQMLTLGAQLLLNPIFLIVGTLAAIGVAFYKLRDDARESINDQIKLYDQLGAAIEARYDREIRIAKSAKEDTAKLESEKLAITQDRVSREIKALEFLRDSVVGLNDEQEKSLATLKAKQLELEADRIVLINNSTQKYIEESKKYVAAKNASDAEIKKIEEGAAERERKASEKATADYVASLEKRKTAFEALRSFVSAAENKLEDDRAVTAQQKLDLDYVRQTEALQKLLDAAKAKGVSEVDIARQRKEALNALDADYALQQKAIDDQIKAEKDAAYQVLVDESTVRNQQEIDEHKAKEDKKARLSNEAEDRAAEHRKQAQAGTLALAGATFQGLQSLSDIYFSVQGKNLEKGSAKQKAEAKKQFNINKGLSLATATISGIQGVIAAYTSGSAIPIIGAVAGPAYAVLAGIAAAANIAKIASAKFDDGGGGAGASVTASSGGAPNIPEATSSPAAIPNFSQFQQNSTGGGGANNTSANGTTNQQSVIKAYVVSQEITDQQTANNYSNSMGSL